MEITIPPAEKSQMVILLTFGVLAFCLGRVSKILV